MDRPARLFLCAECRVQVALCSHCDHGNLYCGRSCWRRYREVARREASSRYQRSRPGRLAHAARTRRWRQRQSGRRFENVTHQRCPAGGVAAPLVTWTQDTTSASSASAADANLGPLPVAAAQSATSPPTPTHSPLGHCRHCAAPLTGWLRQDFLRRSSCAAPRATSFTRPRHDHSP